MYRYGRGRPWSPCPRLGQPDFIQDLRDLADDPPGRDLGRPDRDLGRPGRDT